MGNFAPVPWFPVVLEFAPRRGSMGLLEKLFGSPQSPKKPYVEAGTHVTLRLVQSLSLQGWENGLPSYTQDEMEAINHKLDMFQRMANEKMGGTAVFHPEVAEEIQRRFAAEGLEDLAGLGWKFTAKDTVPEDWKLRVSTYLKAWACKLNPQTFLDMAEMLNRAGYKTEAREAWEVVLLFPSYASRYFGSDNRELTNQIVDEAKQALLVLKRESETEGFDKRRDG